MCTSGWNFSWGTVVFALAGNAGMFLGIAIPATLEIRKNKREIEKLRTQEKERRGS